MDLLSLPPPSHQIPHHLPHPKTPNLPNPTITAEISRPALSPSHLNSPMDSKFSQRKLPLFKINSSSLSPLSGQNKLEKKGNRVKTNGRRVLKYRKSHIPHAKALLTSHLPNEQSLHFVASRLLTKIEKQISTGKM